MQPTCLNNFDRFGELNKCAYQICQMLANTPLFFVVNLYGVFLKSITFKSCFRLNGRETAQWSSSTCINHTFRVLRIREQCNDQPKIKIRNTIGITTWLPHTALLDQPRTSFEMFVHLCDKSFQLICRCPVSVHPTGAEPKLFKPPREQSADQVLVNCKLFTCEAKV